MIEPRVEEKINASVRLLKLSSNILPVTVLPALKNASMIRRNRRTSIFGMTLRLGS